MKRSEAGFTLIELIMTIAIMGLMLAFISEFFLTQTKSYSLVANRQETLGDARYALNRIAYELLRVNPTSEITDFDTTSINFVDDSGTATSFSLNTVPSTTYMGIFRGPDLMIGHINSLDFTYYNSAGAILNPAVASASSIARIRIKIVAGEKQEEENTVLQTSIIPRSVIGYDNFQ